MKKIFAIMSFSNESDIIESSCRYNLTYCDGIIIRDNKKSLDNTREIVQSLIDEGLPIYFVDDIWKTHPGIPRHLAMVQKAFDIYGADLVVPLDPDEFLYHTDGQNPRVVLEELSDSIEYHIPWRTYIYEHDPDDLKSFLPNNFTSYRNPLLERHNKTLMSRFLLKNKQATFAAGSHYLIYPEEHKGTVIVENPPKLVYAHFPVRSEAQIMTKAITGWLCYYRVPFSERKGLAFQWGALYDEFKKHGYMSLEGINRYSVEYGVSDEDLKRILPRIEGQMTFDDVMDVSFCADRLTLRYTDYGVNKKTFFRSLLTEMETTFTALPKREKDTIALLEKAQQQNDILTQRNNDLEQQNSTITQQNNDLGQQNNDLGQQNNDLGQQNNDLAQQIADIYVSNTWKIGKRLQKLYRMVVPYHEKPPQKRKT